MPRKGDFTSEEYSAKHTRITKILGKPKRCTRCGTTDPEKRYEWATRHGCDGIDPDDYIRLCKSCHRSYDSISYLRLTPDEMSGIRTKYRSGRTIRSLAHEYEVGTAYVSSLVNDLKLRPTEEIIAWIQAKRDEGMSWRSIARTLGVTHNTPKRWLSRSLDNPR